MNDENIAIVPSTNIQFTGKGEHNFLSMSINMTIYQFPKVRLMLLNKYRCFGPFQTITDKAIVIENANKMIKIQGINFQRNIEG